VSANDQPQGGTRSDAPVHSSSASVGPPRRRRRLVAVIACACVLAGAAIGVRAVRSRAAQESEAEAAQAVSVVVARASTFTPRHQYVATVQPWISANIGPQFVSAYIESVRVRPGAVVKRGDVLATLDCRDAADTMRAEAAEAAAITARQKALADEASRIGSLLDGGFVSPNEVEQKLATSESQLARLMATKAQLANAALWVNDCTLRAPFDGEVSVRELDPGAFVHPQGAIVTIVDRSTVRVTAEIPEGDFAFVAPGTRLKIHMRATGQDLTGVVSRRAPAASDSTSTVHIEIDVPDPTRRFPVGTTAEVTADVGAPVPATVVPREAVELETSKAVFFRVKEDGRVEKAVAPLLGIEDGLICLDPQGLKPGSRVVTEGRALLKDGERVIIRPEPSEQVDPIAGRPAEGAKP
jgi:membrane fusion protein (multidrug efflux system)